MWIDPSPYVPEWQYPRPWLYIPLHLAFMGETWLGAFQPFTMAPYWSLSYEAWYYAFFGLVFSCAAGSAGCSAVRCSWSWGRASGC